MRFKQNMICNTISHSNKVEMKTISEKYSHNEDLGTRLYEYDDAVDLTGNGWYNRGLLIALSIGLLGMGIDIFGFSVIVTGCTCDFELELWQKSTMLSMPFVGPILMSIPWGYISDTKGRRRTLLIALWGSFISSLISAFSSNWIMLAVLKVFSSCFAVQSGAYALLGESCSTKVRGFYMLIMTSVLMLFLVSYVVPGFFILQLNFASDLFFVKFTPWRLLSIVMAAPLGISGLMLHFFYESPKFLVNAGRETEALEYLERIWERNGNKEVYPVRRVVLKEEAVVRIISDVKISLLMSLWEQTIPLFKPPLLWRTLQLFFLTTVIYSINNSLVMWMPYIVEAFTAGVSSETSSLSGSLCSIIMRIANATVSFDEEIICSSSIQSRTLLSGITHGVVFAGITLAVSKFASRKKAMMIAFLLIPMLSAMGAIFNQNNIGSLILYVGMMMTNLCMGVLFAYYVELFPTSYRGMAACLGVMVARISGLAGVNFLGMFLMTNCAMTFYAFSAYLLSGIAVAIYFLPPDKPKKLL